ncbi:MAG: alanine--tRNA ligase, partial [Gammaproteobacteria bacterium]|nr:alanine--tRNA ligase [Gammaproteobacteria bacterium]
MRRIIRRAIRHGHKLGITETFFYKLVRPLVEVMGHAYPELLREQITIERILNEEELQFKRTLDQGLKILEQDLLELKSSTISGEMAFKLYDTYGFPVDLTADIARERNL